MRAFALLFCLALVACAGGGKIPGAQSEPFAAATGAVTPPAARSAAQRAPAPAAEDNPDAPTPTGDPLTQARADCWMKTEKLKMRDIDARAAFVDKCVTEVMKTGRSP
jgi:hypothetical protein